VLFLAACSSALDPEADFVCAPERFENGAVLTLTSNYETSSLDLLHPECEGEIRQNRVVASGDAVLRQAGGRPIVVNRGAESNLMVLDRDLAVVSQIALPGCGPHDVLALSENVLVVSCYESSVMQKVYLDEERSEPWLDLSPFAGPDGFTEMDALALNDTHFFVTLQNLDRSNNWISEKPGTLLVYELGTWELTQELTLPCDNPYTQLHFAGNSNIWIGCAGSWAGDQVGTGVVSVHLEDWSATVLYDGLDLQGRPTAMDIHGAPLVMSATPSESNAWDVESMQIWELGEEEPALLYQEAGYSFVGCRDGDLNTFWLRNVLTMQQRVLCKPRKWRGSSSVEDGFAAIPLYCG